MGVFLAIISGFFLLGFLWISAMIAAVVFWIWMFVESIRNDYNNKPIWILIIIIGNLLGAIAFYFAVYKRPKPTK